MANFRDIIDEEIEREGGKGSLTNDPDDKGGLTYEGLSSRTNPDLFKDGKIPTEEQVRDRYERLYIKGPGFDRIPQSHSGLQRQLIDFGVTSGPGLAITRLQAIVGATVDGVIGQETIGKLSAMEPKEVNNLLLAERVKMLGRIVVRNPSQLKFLSGWLTRAFDFLQ